MEFQPFPKIPRLKRDIVITEKIDGTNACIAIDTDGKFSHAQSRNKIITPGKLTDNAGFAQWCETHKEELELLGPGYHYGEWYGNNIQSTYGLKEKRFALFNTGRWNSNNPPPACCEVVPVLYHGPMSMEAIDDAMNLLEIYGSQAVAGFMQPEGIMVFHVASKQIFKRTFVGDAEGKERANASNGQ